jgi:hypothetical protein
MCFLQAALMLKHCRLLMMMMVMLQVCDPRVLFSGRHDLREKAGSRPVDSWMWDGLALDAALDKFANEGGRMGSEQTFFEHGPLALANMAHGTHNSFVFQNPVLSVVKFLASISTCRPAALPDGLPAVPHVLLQTASCPSCRCGPCHGQVLNYRATRRAWSRGCNGTAVRCRCGSRQATSGFRTLQMGCCCAACS